MIPLSELGTGVRAQITTSPATNPDSIEELAHQAEIGGPTGLAAIARLATLASQGSESHIEPSPLIDALVERRNRARLEKDWSLSDELRDALLLVGIEIQDGAEGTSWRKLS